YQIEQPDYNIEAACSEEMERRGTLPEKPYPPLVGPTSRKVWLERGERDVKARCPDQLQIFRHVIHAGLSLSATVNIDPRIKQISITWEDNGWQSRDWRRRNEAQLLKRDSGGKAAVDL
ncbi:MAG: hypothetical protein OQL28_07695, partial [Sedimenticola sp.]|nr:hypothetical protein [Sedimenticola sp.]